MRKRMDLNKVRVVELIKCPLCSTWKEYLPCVIGGQAVCSTCKMKQVIENNRKEN